MDEELERYRAAQVACWLESVRAAGARAESLRREVEALRGDMAFVKGVDYSRGGGGQPDADAIPRAVERLQESVDRYALELASYAEMQADAHERLSLMRSPERSECLRRRYLLGQEWADVCEAMGYTRDGMMKLRRRALAEAWDVAPLRWRDPAHPAL